MKNYGSDLDLYMFGIIGAGVLLLGIVFVAWIVGLVRARLVDKYESDLTGPLIVEREEDTKAVIRPLLPAERVDVGRHREGVAIGSRSQRVPRGMYWPLEGP